MVIFFLLYVGTICCLTVCFYKCFAYNGPPAIQSVNILNCFCFFYFFHFFARQCVTCSRRKACEWCVRHFSRVLSIIRVCTCLRVFVDIAYNPPYLCICEYSYVCLYKIQVLHVCVFVNLLKSCVATKCISNVPIYITICITYRITLNQLL